MRQVPWRRLDVEPPYHIGLVIYGPPATKLRARSGQGMHYTHAKTVEAEQRVQLALRQTHRGLRPDREQAFTVRLRFFLPNYRRADIDNLEKLILDAMNSLVWADDQQVMQMHSEVYRGVDVPGTEIAIGTLDRRWR